MKHKFLLAGLIFLFSLSLSAETANGTCGAQGDNLTWTLNTETGILTISGTGAMTNYTISSKAPWYYYSIKTVIIENGVTSIGSYAFIYCSSLTSVTIPNSVTSIGNYAFCDCSSLTSVTIPSSVTSIGEGAFRDCSNLTSITIPNSVTSIGEHTFYNCSGLTSVTIGSSVTSIGNCTFEGCSSLNKVVWNAKKCNDSYYYCTPFYDYIFSVYGDYVKFDLRSQITSFIIGDDVEYIPAYLCYGMTNLTSINIPNSVTSIGNSAFSDCKIDKIYFTGTMEEWVGKSWSPGQISSSYSLYINNSLVTNAVIPNSVTSIGNYAFNGCSGLTSITIPNSVTSIGNYAFYNCSGLTSVTIPNSVTNIGDGAFRGCSSLTSVVWNAKNCNSDNFGSQVESFIFGNEVEVIPDSICRDMTKLTSVTIPNSVTSIGNSAFESCSGLTSVTIPNSVTSIGNSAFYYCSSLTSITIPNSVTSIGNYAFSGCSELKEVHISDIAKWCIVSFGNAYSNPLSFAKNLYVNGSLVTDLVIPEGVTSIGNYTFYGCSSLTSVTIPNSVTSIGEYAFAGCSGLTSVTIPNSVTSIGSSAFRGCSSLTSVTIPNSVTSIGDYVFYGCSSLTSVTFPNSVTSIGDYTFKDCSSLTSVTIPNSVTSIGNNAFYNCSGLTSITIPNSVTSIEDDAFYGCSSLTSVTIPNSVTSIGDRAFYRCSGLTSVTIPNSVTSIGDRAFYSCSGLTSITIGNSVTSIGGSAFSGCSGLTSVTIGNSVTSIGDRAFYNCSGLTSVTIGNSVTSIGGSAFSGCSITSVVWNAKNCNSYNFGSQVKSFTFGNEVEVIPASICSGMTKLTSITIPTSVTSIGKDAFLDCSGLTSIVWNAKNCNYDYVPFYAIRQLITSFTLGENVETIPGKLCYQMDQLTSITFPNSLTSIRHNAFNGCSNLTSVTIPNSVESIGNNAFNGCKSIEFLSLGEGITSYGDYAFQGCSALTTIYNYRERPAKLGTDVFKDVDYFNCTLHVLAGSVDMYKSSGSDWKDFYFVEPIGAASTTTEKVEITPTDNTAGFVWPTVNNAASYELVIKDKQGNDVCTLIFDAQGHLTQIAFAAPDRNRAPEQTAEQVAGFSFTITGLNSGTTYHYTITSKDSNGNTLDTKTGTFRTQGGTATTYTLTVYSADATLGTVSGSGEYEDGEEVTITATPADGYRFVRWSDDNTDNPRTIVLTEDMTLTAYFERIPDALEETDTDHAPRATKVFENGQLYILLPDNTRYNLQGMEVK